MLNLRCAHWKLADFAWKKPQSWYMSLSSNVHIKPLLTANREHTEVTIQVFCCRVPRLSTTIDSLCVLILHKRRGLHSVSDYTEVDIVACLGTTVAEAAATTTAAATWNTLSLNSTNN